MLLCFLLEAGAWRVYAGSGSETECLFDCDGVRMIELAWIHERIRREEFFFSRHGDQERQNDDLTVADVRDALGGGICIEQYEDTGRGESCLLAGFTPAGIPVHAVCGRRGDWLVVVTVYIPRPPRFKNPYERG